MSANPDFIYQPPLTPYLRIIYQDNEIVVLDKPSGLLTVTGRLPEHQDCLQTRVNRVLPTATIVHRLDMATSGIIIMALTKSAHVEISRQFEHRLTEKRYIARVFGNVVLNQGSVDLPLICDWPNRPKQMVCHENGKKSLTHYQVISRRTHKGEDLTPILEYEKEHNHTFKINDELIESTLVELTPITGRSHQLRVHMLALGHPILGDKLYAHQQALALSSRLQLHAQQLIISHPVTSQRITFETRCPFQQY